MHRVTVFAAFALVGSLGAHCAFAVPPDQPPLQQVTQTPNQNYVLRSGLSGTKHYMPGGLVYKMANALDRNGTPGLGNPLGYHAGYVNRGFRVPYFSADQKDVVFWACADNPGGFDCDNGFATSDQLIIPTDVYKDKSESCIRGIVGHELFHHIEFGYTFDGGGSGCGGTFGNTACEGQARALQDKIYFDLDLDPAASCVATFRGQANNYLDNPNRTIWTTSYTGALFWTYLMEQYGEYPFEPSRGIDYLVTWWQLAQSRVANPDVYAITEDAIRVYHPEQSTLATFHDFLIANTMKGRDLSTVSDSFRLRYSYRDEDPVPLFNNQMAFHEAAISTTLTLPPNGASVNQAVSAQRFGGKYYNFDVHLCPTGNLLEFSAAPTPVIAPGPNTQAIVPDGLFALVTVYASANGGKPGTLYKQRSQGWKQTIPQPNPAYDHITAVVSGWHTAFSGNLSLRCAAPPPLPIVAQLSAAHPLLSGTPGSGSVAELLLRLPRASAPGSDAVAALPSDQFALNFSTLNLPAAAALPDGDGYRVLFPTPGLPLGTQDVNVGVAAYQPGFLGGVRVAAFHSDVMLAIDASSSMALPSGNSRLAAVKNAARALTQGLPAEARLGLIRFAGNSIEPDNDANVVVPAAPLNSAQRATLAAALDGMQPATATGVTLSDTLITSIAELDAHGSSGERHLVLISDGGDGPTTDVAALIDQARAAGLRVHTLSLGPLSDQPLLARLARSTGGEFRYVDIDTNGADTAALDSALRDIADRIARRQVLVQGNAIANPGVAADVFLNIDTTNDDATTPHVKVFSGVAAAGFAGVHLFRPDGSEALPGADVELVNDARHFTYIIGSANGGVWKLHIDPDASGRAIPFIYRASLADAKRQIRLGYTRENEVPAELDHFRRGDTIGVHAAILDLANGTPPTAVRGLIKAGAGTLVVKLHDDGANGDAHAGDRIYSALLRSTNISSSTSFPDNEAAPGERGSYAVHVIANFGGATGGSSLETDGAFAVLNDNSDADGDGMPDRYETAHACLAAGINDATADSDGDGAGNAAEYAAGGDPCDVDSDDGGETDGSELAHGSNPLDAADDALPRIRDIEIVHQEGEHEVVTPLPSLSHTIRFSSDLHYATVLIKRASSPAGPYADLATINAASAHGRFVDLSVVAGNTYCYQFIARSSDGRTAAASDSVCDVAHMDETAPSGSIVIDDGAPRTSNPLLALHLEIDNENAATSQMRLRCADGGDSGWIAFASSAICNASALGTPAVANVSVLFRDADGNESTAYSDDIDLVPLSARAHLFGSINVDNSGIAGSPIAGAAILPDHDSEASVVSALDGSFDFPDIAPGSYVLSVESPGYVARSVNVTVNAGNTVNLGAVMLLEESIFRNGFE